MAKLSARPGARIFFWLILVGVILTESACKQNVRKDVGLDPEWQALRDQIEMQRIEISDLQQKLGVVELELAAVRRRTKETVKPQRISKKTEVPPLIEPEVLAPAQALEKVTDSRHGNVQFYLEGYQFLRAGKHDKADISLRRFLSLEPTHVYADRANHLLVLNNFKNKEYGVAILEGSKFEGYFPQSFKIPDVLWLLAESHRQLGQQGAAERIFERLRKEFPHFARSET